MDWQPRGVADSSAAMSIVAWQVREERGNQAYQKAPIVRTPFDSRPKLLQLSRPNLEPASLRCTAPVVRAAVRIVHLAFLDNKTGSSTCLPILLRERSNAESASSASAPYSDMNRQGNNLLLPSASVQDDKSPPSSWDVASCDSQTHNLESLSNGASLSPLPRSA